MRDNSRKRFFFFCCLFVCFVPDVVKRKKTIGGIYDTCDAAQDDSAQLKSCARFKGVQQFLSQNVDVGELG